MDRSNADLPRFGPIAAVAASLVVAGLAGIGVQILKTDQQAKDVAQALTGGDATKAPAILRRYGCTGCHDIPGVPGADGKVGGSLAGLTARVYIAGVATNNPRNLVQWIVSPQSFSPRTAMPATGINEREARDVAAWLYQ